jgi:hypothetical protein
VDHSPISISASVLEVLGVCLLAWEVYKGHQMQEIESGLVPIRRLQFLFATGDFRGFYIASRLDSGDPPDAAQKFVDVLGAVAVENAVREEWGTLAPAAQRSLKRWDDKTTPAAMQLRLVALVSGTVLIVVGLVLHLVK